MNHTRLLRLSEFPVLFRLNVKHHLCGTQGDAECFTEAQNHIKSRTLQQKHCRALLVGCKLIIFGFFKDITGWTTRSWSASQWKGKNVNSLKPLKQKTH